MAGRVQTLSNGQKKQVTGLLWRQILTISLIFLALLGGITGFSLWQIKCRLEKKLEILVAQQFEEPRIQKVVTSVAGAKAEVLLMQQIQPEVEKFKLEVNSQLKEIRSIVAKIETMKSQSDSNAKEIEKFLSSAKNSEMEIEKFKKTLLGLQSDFIKINRGLVEIQYFTHKGGMSIPNPYLELIEKKLNEILAIAVPNVQEREKFLKELNTHRLIQDLKNNTESLKKLNER